MKRAVAYFFMMFFFVVGMTKISAQFKDYGWKGGLQLNGVLPATEYYGRNGLQLSSYMDL